MVKEYALDFEDDWESGKEVYKNQEGTMIPRATYEPLMKASMDAHMDLQPVAATRVTTQLPTRRSLGAKFNSTQKSVTTFGCNNQSRPCGCD